MAGRRLRSASSIDFQRKKKILRIVPGIFHTRFYDDPLIVNPAAFQVAAWFHTYLSGTDRSVIGHNRRFCRNLLFDFAHWFLRGEILLKCTAQLHAD